MAPIFIGHSMSETIGRGVIEVVADSSKLKAGIDEAKRSINGMGDAAEKAGARSSKAIDKYIKSLELQSRTQGLSAREADRYSLIMRNASAAQLAAVDAIHRRTEALQRAQEAERAAADATARRLADGQALTARIGTVMTAAVAALATGAIAAYVAFDQLVKKAGDFQDLSEKTGDSAENIASLAVAAATAGIEMDAVGGLAIKLSKNLVGVDDESAAAGAAIKALGLNLDDLKRMSAADRLETIAKAFNGFAESANKGDVAMALFGKAGADALPFLKELGSEGSRQVILTSAQIAQADEYADKQAKLRAEIGLYAQAIAVQLLPAYNDVTAAVKDYLAQLLGANKGTTDLAKNNSIAEFADKAVLALTPLTDSIEGVARAFELLTLAQSTRGKAASALFKGEFAEVIELSKQSRAAAEAIIDRPLFSTGLKRKIADRQIGQFNKEGGNSNDNYVETADSVRDPSKKLDFKGAAPKSTAKAVDPNKILNAQLNLDIATIQKAAAAELDAYSNAERMMEALRSAGLVDDDAYYTAKRRFIEQNTATQELALQEEISRLEQESRTGKNKLEIDKKLVEAEAKFQKVRADGASAVEISAIQQEAANKRIERSYIDAVEAANQYIDTIKKQAALDLAGVGKGQRFRQEQGGRAQIDNGRDNKVDGLDRELRNNQITKKQYDDYLAIVQDTYAKEVQAYNDRTAAINTAQGDWLNGANEALANYLDRARDTASQSADAFTSAFEGMTDGVSSSIAKTIVHGDNLGESLKSVALSISENFIAAFIKIGIQKLLTDKLAATAFAGTIAAQSQAMVAMAGLNAFASTAAIPIVGPVLAPAAGAAAAAGAEILATLATTAASLSIASAANGFDIPAGVNPLTQLHEREMVLPAQHADTIRRLGASGEGGSGSKMPTIINQTTGRVDRVVEAKLSNGERALILQEANVNAVNAIASQMSDPNSKTSRSMSRNFSVPRTR